MSAVVIRDAEFSGYHTAFVPLRQLPELLWGKVAGLFCFLPVIF
jgi:hypothetical protein